MKFLIKIFCAVIFFFFLNVFSPASAQSVPPFKMLLTNGKTFYAKDLPPGKPLIIIYFAPDCEHCQTLMNAFFKKINYFKTAEIVMITFKPLNEVAAFERDYQTQKYSNIIVGTEGTTFYLRMYYKLMNTPFTALYDKRGQYFYSYKNETPVDDLVRRFKLIK